MLPLAWTLLWARQEPKRGVPDLGLPGYMSHSSQGRCFNSLSTDPRVLAPFHFPFWNEDSSSCQCLSFWGVLQWWKLYCLSDFLTADLGFSLLGDISNSIIGHLLSSIQNFVAVDASLSLSSWAYAINPFSFLSCNNVSSTYPHSYANVQIS